MLQIGIRNKRNILLFLMVWVFFALNAWPRFRVPYAHRLRWLLLAAIILTAAFVCDFRVRKPPRDVLLFLIAVIPSVFWTAHKAESVEKIALYVVLIWGGYIFFSSFNTKDELETAIKVLSVVVVAYGIESVLAVVFGFGHVDGGRWYGNTSNPNTLGIYANLSFLASCYWKNRLSGFRKLPLWLMMTASAILAIKSGSRTAIALVALNAVILLLVRFWGTRGMVFIIAAGFGSVVALLSGKLDFLAGSVLERFSAGLTRGEYWEAAINTWKRFPIFGCGYAVSAYHHLSPVWSTALNTEVYGYVAFHNSYLSYLAEIGLWGVAVFGGNTVSRIAAFWRIFWKEQKRERMTEFMLGCLMLFSLACSAYTESFLMAVGSTEAFTFWTIYIWAVVYTERLTHSLPKQYVNGLKSFPEAA